MGHLKEQINQLDTAWLLSHSLVTPALKQSRVT